MMHRPKVNNRPASEGSARTSEVVTHIIRGASRRIGNPMVEALIEEMTPEINGILRNQLGDSEVDLSKMHHNLNRAGRVLERINRRQRA